MLYEMQPDDGHGDETARTLEQQIWYDACLAIEVFSKLCIKSDPKSWPHICVKASVGPVRDIWLKLLKSKLTDLHFNKLPKGLDMNGLVGGLDIATTLATGKPVKQAGFLAHCDQEIIEVSLSSNLTDEVEAELISVLDNGYVRLERDGLSEQYQSRFAMIIFDEADDNQVFLSKALSDRITMHVDLTNIGYSTAQTLPKFNFTNEFPPALCGSDELEKLCALAFAFGLKSMRPVLQSVKVAICIARLNGRDQVGEEDVLAAIKLCLLQRALTLPQAPSEDENEPEQSTEEPEEPQEPENNDDDEQQENDQDENEKPQTPEDLQDLDIETMKSMLPSGMLDELIAQSSIRNTVSSTGRVGAANKSMKRGRPLASILGRPSSSNKLDLIATIRAAVPWQKIRKDTAANTKTAMQVRVRSQDFRIRKYKQQSESTTIFVVDASGSTALNRLGEAKGAIETLLSESYSRRDYVALIAIKGKASETLLAPTRSLVRAKRQLNMLRGGGGTPLAHGLQVAMALFEEEKIKGRIASLVILTDGSANISLEGKGDRSTASENAISVAKLIAASNISCLTVDINRLPNKRTQEICDVMNGTYIAMPFVSSKNISDAVLNTRKG